MPSPALETLGNRPLLAASGPEVYGQGAQRPVRAALYARVSTHDQQTLPLQLDALRRYVRSREWQSVTEIAEIGSGATDRPEREALMKAARRREVDAILVWRLDRWGRSLPDLVGTLQELSALEVGFISVTEALDLTTPGGRAMAGLLAVFAEFEREILRERVRAGIARARKAGRPHGRPATVILVADQITALHQEGHSQAAIARQLNIGRSSVRRILKRGKVPSL